MWTSGSMWGTDKYFWCPLGDRLFAGASFFTPEGSAIKSSFLLAVIFRNTSGVMTYYLIDEGLTRNTRVICEEI